MSRGNSTVKTIIVLVILILVGVLGVLGMNTIRTYTSGAAAGDEPKGVIAKAATRAVGGRQENYAVVTWSSDKATQGVVEYGTTPASLLLRAVESSATTEHSLEISPLKQATSYYFRIRVGEEVYDNGGIPFSFKTKADDTAATPNGAVVPTVALVPTVGSPASTGSASAGASACKTTVDYNNDGTVNSLDFIYCLKNNLGGGSGATPTKAATSSGTAACRTDFDYNGDGTVNSLDYIKCLQTKK